MCVVYLVCTCIYGYFSPYDSCDPVIMVICCYVIGLLFESASSKCIVLCVLNQSCIDLQSVFICSLLHISVFNFITEPNADSAASW